MEETKTEADQRYKLLSEGERRFLELPESELEAHYKRPDLAKKQFLLKIKYRATNAIKEIAWLCDKLPQDQLKKIVSDDRIMDLFKITEKTLDVADWKVQDKDMLKGNLNKAVEESSQRAVIHRDVLEAHVKKLMPHYLSASELSAFKDLMINNKWFIDISSERSRLYSDITMCLRRSNLQSEFIKSKGLERDFESYRSEQMKIQDSTVENYLKYLKTPAGRKKTKSEYNYTDEQMDKIIQSLETKLSNQATVIH